MGKLAIIPKNKKGGIVTGTIFAIGGLVIGVIIILLVVSTIKDADLIADTVDSVTVTNESVAWTGGASSHTLDAGSLLYFNGYNATKVINGSTKAGTNETLIEGIDYTIFSANGSIANISVTAGARVTYAYTNRDSSGTDTIANLSTNFTSGIGNVSAKIPTILLIIAVVFLFGALVLLIRYASSMGIGGGNAGSL